MIMLSLYGYASSEPKRPCDQRRNLLFCNTLRSWVRSLPRRRIPIILSDGNCTIGLDAEGAHVSDRLPEDSSVVGKDNPQQTSWQEEQLIDACCQTDLAVADSFQGGSSTNRFRNRIDYEQRRVIDLKSVRVDVELERLIRHTPKRVDHYPVVVHLEIPPWPVIRKRLQVLPAPKLNQYAIHANQNVPEDRAVAQADLDAFVARYLPNKELLLSLPADDHYFVVNTLIWLWSQQRYGYKAHQRKPWVSDQCWDLIVKCNDIATELATRLDLPKKNICHYVHTKTLASNLFLICKGFIKSDQAHKAVAALSKATRSEYKDDLKAGLAESTFFNDCRTFWEHERTKVGARPRRLGKLPPVPARHRTPSERADITADNLKGYVTSKQEWGPHDMPAILASPQEMMDNIKRYGPLVGAKVGCGLSGALQVVARE